MNIIEEYGYTEFFKNQAEKINLFQELVPARVIEVHREQYKIITNGELSDAKLKGSLFYNNQIDSVYPVIGDFVLAKENPYGTDTIYYVLRRKSKFSRLDTFNKKEQIIAANFDCVFIVTSMNNEFNIKRIERYLTLAWQSGANPVIILTKSDLCRNIDIYKDKLRSITMGVPIFTVSSVTGDGMDELKAFIKPFETIVLLGSSGVGKSSLVNAISEDEIMKVSGIREDDSKGCHTTTYRQLIKLSNGTMIIDTPGMRELGMWEASEGLDSAFKDIEELITKCKFRNCSHEGEPGCKVQEALKNGDLSFDRWNNYIKLKKEAKYAEQKVNIDMKMKEKIRVKSLSKFQKRHKKGWEYYG